MSFYCLDICLFSFFCQQGWLNPLWVAFAIIIGGLMLDVLISVSLGISSRPVNIITGILFILSEQYLSNVINHHKSTCLVSYSIWENINFIAWFTPYYTWHGDCFEKLPNWDGFPFEEEFTQQMHPKCPLSSVYRTTHHLNPSVSGSFFLLFFSKVWRSWT